MPFSPLYYQSDAYLKSIEILDGIKFTRRELDILACILSGKSVGVIASLLDISSRTLEGHLSNIRSKLSVSSRNGIIVFLEKSDKLAILKEHYQYLRIQSSFRETLRKFSKLVDKKIAVKIFYDKNQEDLIPFIQNINLYLALANIKVILEPKDKNEFLLSPDIKNAACIIHILNKQTLDYLQSEENIKQFFQPPKSKKTIPIIFALCNTELLNKNIQDIEFTSFDHEKSFYHSFLELLQKILPDINCSEVITEFNKIYKTIPKLSESTVILENKNSNIKKGFFKSYRNKIISTILLFFSISGIWLFNGAAKHTDPQSIRSDLMIPIESALLKRPELIAQIKKKLNQSGGIQTVALVGMGGIGKTTIARQFGRLQDSNLVWEINAETKESLINSFKDLANALTQTKEDKEKLEFIKTIHNQEEREKQLFYFVRKHLKAYPDWLLIYDNTDTFSDVKNYLPQDYKVWGNGKVIITTRDNNIQNASYISSNNVIHLSELSEAEALTLFSKILYNCEPNKLALDQKEKILNFLKHIPLFPLDISVAAYYIKATNISFATYLENLLYFNKGFTRTQENILRDMGEYSKVRYCIITSSLKKILEKNLDFKPLLLTLFLLDSQNIPIELLNTIKDNMLVSNFILSLKRYSLLTNVSSNSSLSAVLSIHRSTQTIGLYYLQQSLGLENTKQLVKSISEKFLSYIEKAIKEENINKMKFIIPHYQAFLSHKDLLTPDIEGLIKGQLGIIYYFLGDNLKAKTFLEESLSLLDTYSNEYPTYIALFKGYLGNALRDLGDYQKARTLIEKAILIYAKHYPQDNFRYAYFLSYLGIIERYLGHYDAAQNTFEKGLVICKKHFPEHINYKAWVSGQLAILDRERGNYEQAKKGLEASLEMFEKDLSPDHFDIAWALEHLGVVYTKLNQYTKAQQALERSLRIYAGLIPDQIGPAWILAICDSLQSTKNYKEAKSLFDQLIKTYPGHFHDNYIYVAYPLSKLANLNIQIGNYQKAKLLLEQCLLIYQRNYGEHHLTLAPILTDLGLIYFLENKLEDSENLLKKALEIFQSYNHVDQYECLKSLSALYLRKSFIEMKKGNKQYSQTLRNQSAFFLNKIPSKRKK